MSEEQLDLTKIKGQESEGVNLEQFHKKLVVLENVEVVKVPSTFTPLIEGTDKHQDQWVLKVSSEIIHSVGEGEEKIDFRASEYFNLMQDEKGNLTGFPLSEKSNLGKFLSDLRIDLKRIDHLAELVEVMKGKKATVKAYTKEVDVEGKKLTRTYLKFLY